MGESTKSVCAMICLISAAAGVTAWAIGFHGSMTWGFRIGAPVCSVLALCLLLRLHWRDDLAHDYLREISGSYFNRDGFCFTFMATAVDGIGYMNAFFQNQRDKPSVGRIALRPARGFFMTRSEIVTLTYEIECAPAAFGVARIAIPIPAALQGKRQAFEVGASVRYPEGRGRRVRFRDGTFLRGNTKFRSSFRTALTVAGAAAGSIVLSRPATITLVLPVGVAEDIPETLLPEIRTLWRSGDPRLGSVFVRNGAAAVSEGAS